MSDIDAVPAMFHHTGATDRMSWEERALLRRTRQTLSGWEYKYWTDSDLVTLFRSELPQWSERFKGITRGVVKADLGRYAIMHCCGGIYVDTDYKFIKYPSGLLKGLCTIPVEQGSIEDVLNKKPDYVFRLGNACLSSAKKHPFWLSLLDEIFKSRTNVELNEGDPIETTGPVALTQFWLRHWCRDDDIATPRMVEFYPDLTWSRIGLARSPETCGIHMCWGTWRTRKFLHNVKTVLRRKVSCLI